MSALPRSLRRWTVQAAVEPVFPRAAEPVVRLAVDADLPAIAELVAPHVADGSLLPPTMDARLFQVAVLDGALVGCVALKPWSDEVVELGSLVAGLPGRGVGRLLVDAACARAAEQGHATVVALTGTPAFFLRCGWDVVADTPWAVARQRRRACEGLGELGPAIEAKASTCARCPRLGACSQVLLSRPAAAEAEPVRGAA